MSAEGLFKGMGAGLTDVYGQASENARQKTQLDAQAQMEKARLLEEDNIARFREQSEDARSARQIQTEKDLASLREQAEDRRQSAQLTQARDEFEKEFGFKISNTFEEDLSKAEDMAAQRKLTLDQQIATSPGLQMQAQALSTLQQQYEATQDPAQQKALMAQMQANGVFQLREEADQETKRMILSVAKNPSDYAMIQVRVFGVPPTQAAVAAKYRFSDQYTNLGGGAQPGVTPSPRGNTAPSPATSPTPAPGAASGTGTPSGSTPTGAAPDSGGSDLLTPDIMDELRKQAFGPGTMPAPMPTMSVPQPTLQPQPQPMNPMGSANVRFGLGAQPGVMPGGGIPGALSRMNPPAMTPPPSYLGPRFGGAQPGGNDLIPPSP